MEVPSCKNRSMAPRFTSMRRRAARARFRGRRAPRHPRAAAARGRGHHASTAAAASSRAHRLHPAAEIAVDILQHRAIERESPLRVTLVQGVSAGEKMDSTLRKAVELGVAGAAGARRALGRAAEGRARRGPARPLAEGGDRRLRAMRAQPHSGSSSADCAFRLPRQRHGDEDSAFPARSTTDLQSALQGSDFVVAAGPEAGFTWKRKRPSCRPASPASLGPRVLRTETAAVAALAALSALRGDS